MRSRCGLEAIAPRALLRCRGRRTGLESGVRTSRSARDNLCQIGGRACTMQGSRSRGAVARKEPEGSISKSESKISASETVVNRERRGNHVEAKYVPACTSHAHDGRRWRELTARFPRAPLPCALHSRSDAVDGDEEGFAQRLSLVPLCPAVAPPLHEFELDEIQYIGVRVTQPDRLLDDRAVA